MQTAGYSTALVSIQLHVSIQYLQHETSFQSWKRMQWCKMGAHAAGSVAAVQKQQPLPLGVSSREADLGNLKM